MKRTKITALDLKPRDTNIIALLGKARAFIDQKRKQKNDATGRKAKYKERDV